MKHSAPTENPVSTRKKSSQGMYVPTLTLYFLFKNAINLGSKVGSLWLINLKTTILSGKSYI